MVNDDDEMLRELMKCKLHRAAQEGDIAKIDLLLEDHHHLNHFDELGHTPLHYAVQYGHLDAVERLLQAGADVNANDSRVIGNTPLSDNAEKCSFEMAHQLIAAGADPTIRGWMQLNAIDHAKQRKDPDARRIVDLLQKAANHYRN